MARKRNKARRKSRKARAKIKAEKAKERVQSIRGRTSRTVSGKVRRGDLASLDLEFGSELLVFYDENGVLNL